MSLRTLQTCGWIVFLGYTVFGGVAVRYVIDWQVWLLLGSLVVLTLGLVCRQWDRHSHHHNHSSHDHEPATWGETGVHFLPLVLLIVVGQTVLGTHSLGNGLGVGVTPPPQTRGDMHSDADGYRHTDLLAVRHEPFLAGGKIAITARLGELAEQTTRRRRHGPAPIPKPVLFRHVISCCAADGRPIYAWIADDSPIPLPLDSWVAIRGTVNERETGGVVPVITVHDWQTVPEPNQPYLILPGAVKVHK